MKELQQFRGKKASLWQSAIDQAVAKRSVPQPASSPVPVPDIDHLPRPAQTDPGIQHGNVIAAAIDVQAPPPVTPPPAAGVVAQEGTAEFCASAAFRLAEAQVHAALTGDYSALPALHAQLDTPFAQCDPKWGEVLAIYAASRIADTTIPYRRYNDLQDFVIDDRLPSKATVAILADWGTGQDAAKVLLAKVAALAPDVVIHLGDVYYSGTQCEVQNYFYSIWQQTLKIPLVAWGQKLTDLTTKPATFHMPGNHDMYAGGQPYYTVIDMLGQPASYFCLRNNDWQFVAMDTSLHDSDPLTVNDATFVDDREILWMKDKVKNADGRQTVLLSHHQLFTAFEKIGGQAVNQKLLPQVEDILPDLTLWLWGHEHNLVIYKEYMNVLGRCIGHGAFPVCGTPPYGQPNAGVPLENVKLDLDPTNFYRHGYVLMKLDGPNADLSYIQVNAETGAENCLFHEVFPHPE